MSEDSLKKELSWQTTVQANAVFAAVAPFLLYASYNFPEIDGIATIAGLVLAVLSAGQLLVHNLKYNELARRRFNRLYRLFSDA